MRVCVCVPTAETKGHLPSKATAGAQDVLFFPVSVQKHEEGEAADSGGERGLLKLQEIKILINKQRKEPSNAGSIVQVTSHPWLHLTAAQKHAPWSETRKVA